MRKPSIPSLWSHTHHGPESITIVIGGSVVSPKTIIVISHTREMINRGHTHLIVEFEHIGLLVLTSRYRPAQPIALPQEVRCRHLHSKVASKILGARVTSTIFEQCGIFPLGSHIPLAQGILETTHEMIALLTGMTAHRIRHQIRVQFLIIRSLIEHHVAHLSVGVSVIAPKHHLALSPVSIHIGKTIVMRIPTLQRCRLGGISIVITHTERIERHRLMQGLQGSISKHLAGTLTLQGRMPHRLQQSMSDDRLSLRLT